MPEIVYSEESYQIGGACFQVHNNKGSGFLEPVYQECLEIELEHQQVPFVAQPELKLDYRGRVLKQTYNPDFVVYDKIILEIKAVAALCDEHRAQVQSYLHASGLQLGILVNFGAHPKLTYERFALTGEKRRNR